MHILDEELYQAGMAIAACPTAPGHETHVQACLRQRLADLPHLSTRLDEFGNLHALYEHESDGREPIRLVAHLDHPAFVVDRRGEPELHFAGGVDENYFAGKAIVFYHGSDPVPLGRAVITGTDFSGERKRVLIDSPIPAPATFAMWNLPPATCTKELFISPACDDLAQVATVLALLGRLALSEARAHVHALFTRAEEIGFAGAIAALKCREPLTSMVTLSLETSKARGFAEVGAGPIVRVGDRASIFHPYVTQWLETSFRELQIVRPETTYQRLLMGGGPARRPSFFGLACPPVLCAWR